MNNKLIKRVLSCILAAVMVFGLTSAAFATTAESEYKNPIIVVNGIGNNPIMANPNTAGAEVVFPPDDVSVKFLIGEMLTLTVTAVASGDYKELMNFFVGSQLFEQFELIQPNPDGTSKSDNLGPNKFDHSVAYYKDEIIGDYLGSIGEGMASRVGADHVYVYTYDWRLDPIEQAKGLDEFVQNVKTQSRKSQVSIISEGYGSTIATTYMAECYENAIRDVDNFVTVNSAFEGTSLIGDIFTGHLIHSVDELQHFSSAFIRWTNDVSDNPITWFSTWLVNYILNRNWEIQDLMNQVIVMMAHVLNPLYDDYLREMLKSYPGLWAMVPVDYYEEALDFMFINDPYEDGEYNSDLQENIQAFKNYQMAAYEKDTSNFLVKAQSEGVNVAIISCWDLQLIPIGDNKASENGDYGLSAQSDGLIDTKYSSFGATTIALNNVGEAACHRQEYKEGECAGHDHLSSVYDKLDPVHGTGAICHYVDASTCALPENTFFIRNMKFGTFDKESGSMDFLLYLTTATTTTSIRSNGKYHQFNNYNRYVKPGILNWEKDSQYANHLLGDVNCDGTVSIADARLALRIAAKLEKYPDVKSLQFLNADVNGDGKITTADARIILRVCIGISDFEDFRHTTDEGIK